MMLHAATLFLSAFLLFLVQPLIGKAILPWFGGSPGVWMTCMLFFQALLLAGYAYAHLVATRLSPRAQGTLHLVLLAATLALLPILPSPSWKPSVGDDPALRILLLLAVSVGPPFFMLSATGPLLQSWFSKARPARSPYRLYALSNAGSLLALLAYPFALESSLRLVEQDTLWSTSYVLFALLCGACAAGLIRRKMTRALISPARISNGTSKRARTVRPEKVAART